MHRCVCYCFYQNHTDDPSFHTACPPTEAKGALPHPPSRLPGPTISGGLLTIYESYGSRDPPPPCPEKVGKYPPSPWDKAHPRGSKCGGVEGGSAFVLLSRATAKVGEICRVTVPESVTVIVDVLSGTIAADWGNSYKTLVAGGRSLPPPGEQDGLGQHRYFARLAAANRCGLVRLQAKRGEVQVLLVAQWKQNVGESHPARCVSFFNGAASYADRCCGR